MSESNMVTYADGMITVDVIWYKLTVDPSKVLVNMNIRDFKKMLRICCNALPFYDDQVRYLYLWFTYLTERTEYDPFKRRRMKNAIDERLGKL